MKEYRMELCGIERHLPFVHINDNMAFASFVVIGDTELISAAAPELAKKIGPVDGIITAEAKGIALAYDVSRQLGLKEFIVARKSVKTYMHDVVKEQLKSITTAKPQDLFLDGEEVEKIRGKNICVLDDVISTGESLLALEKLASKAGARVVCRAALLAEGDAAKRTDIVFLQKLPLFRILSNGEYEEMIGV